MRGTRVSSQGKYWSGRHSEQPPMPLARRQRRRHYLPGAVEQQQRQHIRFQGRQLFSRAYRPAYRAYEHDGSITVVADAYTGCHLNRRTMWRRIVMAATGLRSASGLLVVRGGTRSRGHPDQTLKGAQLEGRGKLVGVGTGKREIMTANGYRVRRNDGQGRHDESTRCEPAGQSQWIAFAND